MAKPKSAGNFPELAIIGEIRGHLRAETTLGRDEWIET
jgi:hypothetical protein